MKGWLDWIKTKDDHQVRWAVNYLFRKNMIPAQALSLSTTEALATTIRSWGAKNAPGSEKFELLDKKMRAAWGQQVRRKKLKGQKAYSFTMKQEVGPALDALAKFTNNTISQALENMILTDHRHSKVLKEKHEEELASIKAEQDKARKIYPKRKPSMTLQLKSGQIDKRTIERQWGLIKDLLEKELVQEMSIPATELAQSKKDPNSELNKALEKRLESCKKELEGIAASPQSAEDPKSEPSALSGVDR